MRKISAIVILLFTLVFANDLGQKTITVIGRSSYQPVPEIINLKVELNNEGINATEAQNFHKKETAKFYSLIKKFNFEAEDIKTVSFGLFPIKDDKSSTVSKFNAKSIIQIKIYKIAGLGKFFDAMLALKSTKIVSLKYTIGNRDALKAKALQGALADAQYAAEVIAKQKGLTLGGVASIEEEISENIEVEALNNKSDLVEPLNVDVQVKVVYLI